MTTRYIVRHGTMRFLGDYQGVEQTAYLRGQTASSSRHVGQYLVNPEL